MPNSIYNIQVQKASGRKEFRLYNHDEPCGHRLYKGDSKTNKDGKWPFRSSSGDWRNHLTLEEARTAASKLQIYLEIRDAELFKTRSQKTED